MRASSTVPAKIPGIPTVQLSGSTLQQQQASDGVQKSDVAVGYGSRELFGGGNRTGCIVGAYPALERRPAVGLNPTTPHSDAGIRTEPAAQARTASFSVIAR
jgi:hypothetical protein